MEEIEEMFHEDPLKADPTEQNIRLTSIKASFDHSFNGLSFDLRQLLVKLTLFQSPFPISAVKQIFGFDKFSSFYSKLTYCHKFR